MTPRLAGADPQAADRAGQGTDPRRRRLPLPPPPDPRRRVRRSAEGRARRPARSALPTGSRITGPPSSSWTSSSATTSSRPSATAASWGLEDAELAAAARERLATAGRRALNRLDFGSAAGLLDRAAELAPAAEVDLALETDLIDALTGTKIDEAIEPRALRLGTLGRRGDRDRRAVRANSRGRFAHLRQACRRRRCAGGARRRGAAGVRSRRRRARAPHRLPRARQRRQHAGADGPDGRRVRASSGRTRHPRAGRRSSATRAMRASTARRRSRSSSPGRTSRIHGSSGPTGCGRSA